MILNIRPGLFPQTVYLPTSKSYANRALILGAVKKSQTTFQRLPKASDVTNLLSALEKVGLQFKIEGENITFLNSFPACENRHQGECVVEIGEGGTTARFLACMLLLGTKPYTLKLGTRLKERPWDEFINLVNSYGAKCSLEDDLLFIQGPVHFPSVLEVDCSRTTQFATGFALSFHNTTKIAPVALETSQSYWEMTLKLIGEFSHCHDYLTPIDWSSASYPLALAAHTQETFFPGLRPDSYQADSKFYDLLLSLGLLEQKDEGVLITPKKVARDIKMDVADCLDLVPTLVFFLSYVKGHHELVGVENLVFKESDRLSESVKILNAFEVKNEVRGNSLLLEGTDAKLTKSIDLALPDDHRMVMSAALFMRLNAGGNISPKEAVNKSYPEFFSLFI